MNDLLYILFVILDKINGDDTGNTRTNFSVWQRIDRSKDRWQIFSYDEIFETSKKCQTEYHWIRKHIKLSEGMLMII